VNTPQVPSPNSWQTMVFSIELFALIPHSKMELPKGNIGISLKLV